MIQWHFKTFDQLAKKELYEIIGLRLQVFVVEQNAPYQDTDRKDYNSFHIFGTQEDEVVAYARLIPAGITFAEPCLGRVVNDASVRKTGTGRILVNLALEAMKTRFKTTDCRISAQLYLKDFYESFGFRQVSDVYLEDGIPHIEMLK